MVTTGPWRRALVTGASAGIGEAFARRLAAEGLSLVLVARRTELLEKLAEHLSSRHEASVEVLPGDLTNPDTLAAVAERLERDTEPIDLLVNNAGGGTTPRRFVDHARGHIESVAVLNAVAVHHLTHAAAKTMVRRGRGHVIQVSAGVAHYPVPGAATYAASKAFVNSFSEAVARELAGTGAGVTVVCPGFTRTEAPARIGFDESTVPRFLWADPEDVVDAALRAAGRGRPLVYPRKADRAGAFLLRHLPRGAVAAIAGRATLSRPSAAASNSAGTEDEGLLG